MPINLAEAYSRKDNPIHGSHVFPLQEPKSPCFKVLDKFFRFYGQEHIFAFIHVGHDGKDVRRFDVQTEKGQVFRGFLRKGEHFNIGSQLTFYNALTTGSLFSTYMTPAEIEECEKSYIRVPRNQDWGYELQYNAQDKSFGDTFLGSAPKVKKRYTPREFNPMYNPDPIKNRERKLASKQWLEDHAEEISKNSKESK